MYPILNAVLLVLTEECGCSSGVYRDVTTGNLLSEGHYELCQDCSDYYELEALAEMKAEAAAERFFEEGTWAQREQYRWEVEQDERNAAFWSGALA